MKKRHKHDFAAFYTHFGKYGPQDVHYHVCCWEDMDGNMCDVVMVGQGRTCDGKYSTHKRKELGVSI